MPSKTQLRRAKRKAAKQSEGHEVQDQVPSKQAVCAYQFHQTSQTASISVPKTASEPEVGPQGDHMETTAQPASALEPVTRDGPLQIDEKEQNEAAKAAGDVHESDPVHHQSHANKRISRLAITVIAFFLGLCTLCTGLLVLCDQTILAKYLFHPPPRTARESQAVELSSLIVGRHSLCTGLLILSLVYRKKLRATGTLFLCEVVADTVTAAVVWKSGFREDIFSRVMVATVRMVLGCWMIQCD